MTFAVRGGEDVVVSFVSLHVPISDASIALAEDFLCNLFPEPVAQGRDDEAFGEVLETVVAETGDAHPDKKMVIPLTEGFDSRSILGAALRVVGRERILCYTMGERRNLQVLGAEEVCRRNGVEHVRLDPADYRWDPEKSVAHAAAAFKKYRSFGTVESGLFAGLSLFCRQRYGDDYFILSGFLGGVVSGTHLRNGLESGDVDTAVAVFLELNRAYRHYAPSEGVRARIAALGPRLCETLKSRGYAGMTVFDVLDIGLRQALRIRGGLPPEAIVYSPHADPRILSWWYGPRPRQRLGQVRYRQELAGRYPEIFCLPDDKVRRTGTVARPRYTFLNRTARALRARLLTAERKNGSERGDLQTNAEKREVLLDLVRSFGERRLVDLDTDALIRAALTPGAQRLIKPVATAETHLRAGTLQQLEQGPPLGAGLADLPPWRPLPRTA